MTITAQNMNPGCFLEIDDLITNIRIFDAADEVTLSFKQSYTHCLLPVETVEEILTGICQTISGALGGAARRKKKRVLKQKQISYSQL